MIRTGGCQCGAVRFAIEGDLGTASICHCRMCQKAFGSFFGPFVTAFNERLTWTRGQPTYFQSSDLVRRGFCPACGTPLTYVVQETTTELAIGAFDDPSDIAPVKQYSVHTRLPYVDDLAALPAATLSLDPAKMVSYQHPDHDTEN